MVEHGLPFGLSAPYGRCHDLGCGWRRLVLSGDRISAAHDPEEDEGKQRAAANHDIDSVSEPPIPWAGPSPTACTYDT